MPLQPLTLSMLRVLILAASTLAPIVFPAAPNAAPVRHPASFAPIAPIAPVAPGARGAKVENIVVETSDDIELTGSYYEPKRKGRAPGVLLVHDAGGDRKQLEAVAVRLQKSGFGVLTLDLRGHGASRTEDEDWSELSEDDRSALWARATRDVEAGSRWLLSQDGIHTTNLSLVGVGSGCALAVRHAKRDENVRCVALLAPRPKDFGFDVAADLLKIDGLPTLILAVDDDNSAKSMVREANAAGGNGSVELELSPPKVTSILDDRRMPSRVSTYLGNIALPKRGR